MAILADDSPAWRPGSFQYGMWGSTMGLDYLTTKLLDYNEEMLELLEEVSDFNLEARYPDQKFSFHKKCTMFFTKKKLYEIERVKKWLIQRLPSSI